MTGVDDIWPMS